MKTEAEHATGAPAPRRRRSSRTAAAQTAATRTPPRDTIPGRSTRHAMFDPGNEERHERFTLIEFVWDIQSGIQPVILAERKLLH